MRKSVKAENFKLNAAARARRLKEMASKKPTRAEVAATLEQGKGKDGKSH